MQDLTGADFSGCDLRGVDFSDENERHKLIKQILGT
jgi:uncharacterized protein YjbI with pentapeptide repeats